MSAFSQACPLCSQRYALLRNAQAFCRFERNPATLGHMLVVPLRHVDDFSSLTDAERTATFALVESAKALLHGRYQPDGYTVAIEYGEARSSSGHAHLHVIPRYRNEAPAPRDEVRVRPLAHRDY